MVATPAQLALHVLCAVLPREVKVAPNRIRFRDGQELHDLESATTAMEGVRKPIACRAREVDGVLEIHIAEPDNPDENRGNSLILDDLISRAQQSIDERVLVVGHEGNGIVADIGTFAAFEHDYQILENHFVRSDPPVGIAAHQQILRVLSYFPSISQTKVYVDGKPVST
jgi:hypothetical protein